MYTNIRNRNLNLIFDHQTVNHSRHFFSNNLGFSSNNIENVWSQLKSYLKSPGDNESLAAKLDFFYLSLTINSTMNASLKKF